MRAVKNTGIVFTAPNVASVVELPMPSPKEGEVLVRLTRSALSSGTERANLIGVPDGGIGIFGEFEGQTLVIRSERYGWRFAMN